MAVASIWLGVKRSPRTFQEHFKSEVYLENNEMKMKLMCFAQSILE